MAKNVQVQMAWVELAGAGSCGMSLFLTPPGEWEPRSFWGSASGLVKAKSSPTTSALCPQAAIASNGFQSHFTTCETSKELASGRIHPGDQACMAYPKTARLGSLSTMNFWPFFGFKLSKS